MNEARSQTELRSGIDAGLDQQEIDEIVRSVPGGATNVQDIYPLSPLQEGMLFHHVLDAQDDTYVLSTLFELRSATAIEHLIEAVQRVVDRHDALRSAVLWNNLPRPIQVVYRHAELQVQKLQLERSREALEQLKEQMRPGCQKLNLAVAPLCRMQVAVDPNGACGYAVLHVHHIICDHQSLRTIVSETMVHIDDRQHELACPRPYRDYVAQALASARETDHASFFRSKLGDVDESTAPFGIMDVHGGGRRVEEEVRSMEIGLARRIRAHAQRFATSPARLLHAVWALVLARTSGRYDVVFGTVLMAAARGDTQAKSAIGLHVNTLPLRLKLHSVSARELLEQASHELSDLLHHRQAQLTLAQRCSSLPSTSPLFTTLFNFRRSDPEAVAEASRSKSIRVVARGEAWTNYPLTMTVHDTGDGFLLMAKADPRIGSRRLIDYLETAARSFVEALESAPDTPVRSLAVLPEDELHRVVSLFNSTQTPYPRDSTVHELFERQVERTPAAVAVACGNEVLTFAELNQRANQLARYLNEQGVGPDRFVGLCVERSAEMLVGMMAILKAGGAYVPLDPDYPPERLQYMLEDVAPSLVLTQARLKRRLPVSAAGVMAVDAEWRSVAKHSAEDMDSRALGLRAHHAAYVIYTSGSTGRPKGVVVEHRNVLSLWQGLEEIYASASGCERVGVNASFNFDASVKQIVQLLSGRTLVLVPQHARLDAALMINFMEEQRIDAIDCTPWQLRSWLSAGLLAPGRDRPRIVLVGGEPIDTELWNQLAKCIDTEFFNVYGPTESTVDTTAVRLRGDASNSHIGRPIQNRQVYILDAAGEPVPIGVIGEIYIGGAGVARGYLNRADLTVERFVADRFSSDPQARMYRTGDLGRWRADGTIEYLGRNDHQVKIRGFRIEPGEIERHLLQHEQVKDAVVIAREDAGGERRLVAYVVQANSSDAASVEDLRAHVKAVLPDYMVPSAFVTLGRMPLTPNGKLDRGALPAPEQGSYASRKYEPPQGQVEEILAGIWQSALKVGPVGRHHNFFELGGHSLLIVQMLGRLRRMGFSVDVRRVFENPTIAELAGALTREVDERVDVPPNLIPASCNVITPQMLPLVELEPEHIQRIARNVPGGVANIQDIYPLAPLQEGILVHHLLNEHGGDVYVIQLLLSMPSRAVLDRWLEAMQRLIDRHDSLRTAVLWEQLPRPVQVVLREVLLPVTELQLSSDLDPVEQMRRTMYDRGQKLDLRAAPLVHVQIAADPGTESWYALLQLHHIVIDGQSLAIAISEVTALLETDVQGLEVPLSYRDHVARTLAYARKHDGEEFFRAKLHDVDEPTAPFGLLDTHGDGDRIEVRDELSQAFAQRIRAQAQHLGVTSAAMFHAAWGLVVARTSGRNDVVFGSVLLGRMQAGVSAQPTLGMFINTLPLRLGLQGLTAKELIEHTQRELVELLSHEQASLAAAQRCSAVPGSAPLFTSLMNYRHSAAMKDASWGETGIRLLLRRNGTNYPITVSIDDLGKEFALTVQTDPRLDPRRIAAYVQTALQALVEVIQVAPQTPVLSLRVMPTQERVRLIEEFNSTRESFAQDKLIHELFEEQVALAPQLVAVVHEQQMLTYRELNDRANQLARHLREHGVGPGRLVGVCLQRSPDMVVGLLGILKAGGAYMPLDPSYPAERLEYMLRDGAPHVVLTETSLASAIPFASSPVIELDAKWRELVRYDTSDLSRAEVSIGEHLLYVIYTSGSTGRPKGTAMPHRSMVNLIEWHRRTFRNITRPRVLQFAALSFDVAFQEIFTTLCTGGALVLIDEWARRDPASLIELLSRQYVDRLFVPPLMLQVIAELHSAMTAQLVLKDVITAGEQLRVSPEIVGFFNRLNGCRLHNHYGPTETHVVTALTLGDRPDEWPSLPSIGKPISNTQIYILDAAGDPVPLGAIGEIHIGGANLASGYLHRPKLTQERFVRDPFADDPNARMYKTGDLGRWHADGTIEYLGRNDDQLKLRGYRIELGEIEAQLAGHEQVKEAAVTAREDIPGRRRLVAYVTTRGSRVPGADELRTFLKKRLPDHMIPSAFVILERLPLTSSGKLNRRVLPPPGLDACVDNQYRPPQGAIEETLSSIWQSLLEVERVGREDNFFEIGGHSLLVLKAVYKMNEALGCSLRVIDVYSSPTIRDLAARINGEMQVDAFVDLHRESALDSDIVASPGSARIPEKVILLTGATGFVGRFLLAQLLRGTDATIYCMVRARSNQEAQFRVRTTLISWDLWRDEFEGRVVPVRGDLRAEKLGIDHISYRTFARDVDAIYHCATSMNHLETYAMAKSANVDASKELLRLAMQGAPKVVNYISTLGVFSPSPDGVERLVHESSPIEHERHSCSRGYVASKWVGEKIFKIANERGIPCNIFRIGLVWADSELGRYDELQRGYRLVKSCLLSGCGIRDYRFEMAPTPVDYVARAVVFLATCHPEGNGVFHIASGVDVCEGLFEQCNVAVQKRLELLSYYDWICEMRRLHLDGKSMPVVPLIEFAFEMDETAFNEHQRGARSGIRFDCAQTHDKLARGGIVVPEFGGGLLSLTIEDMLRRDVDLRGSAVVKTASRVAHRASVRL